MAKLATLILFLSLSLCTFAQAEQEKETTNFATSVSMLKDKQYLAGPLWVVADRHIKDPQMWDIKLGNTEDEEIYRITVLMVFFDDNKSVNQKVVRIFQGTIDAGEIKDISIRASYKHTHIGFTAVIEK